MIKYNPKLWFKHIFHFPKSDTVYLLWKELIILGIFSAGVTYVEIEYMEDTSVFKDMIAVYSLVGFVLSLLLVFRTNTAYDRWWEGRKKWGALVNDTRNLAIKISSIIKEQEHRTFFTTAIPNFVFATKEHLRDGVVYSELELTEQEAAHLSKKEHVPNAISQQMYLRTQQLKSEGKISQEEFLVLDKNMNALLDSLGACERIKNTPIPFSYSLFLKKFIFIYVTTIPLAFIGFWVLFYYYSDVSLLCSRVNGNIGRRN